MNVFFPDIDISLLVRQRYIHNAQFLLSLERVDNSFLCQRLGNSVNRLKKVRADRLPSFLASSGLQAWLRLLEARISGSNDWFSHLFLTWAGLTSSNIDDFLVEYFDLRMQAIDDEQRGLGVSFIKYLPACKRFKLSLENRLMIDDHFFIDASDPFLLADFPGMETLPREISHDVHHRYAGVIHQSLGLIENWSKKFRNDIKILIIEIVPCRSQEQSSIPSGTCTVTPAAIFISCVDNVDATSELVIHETSHIYLGLLNREISILKEGISQSTGWEDEVYYSPWRDQPRSLMGIMHAIYVFSQVLDYHCYRFLDNPQAKSFSADRLVTLNAQIKIALNANSLRDKVSTTGLQILNFAEKTVAQCENLATKALNVGAAALFAERHHLWTPPSLRVDKIITDHYNWYKDTYFRGV